jgi:hypothetical protein
MGYGPGYIAAAVDPKYEGDNVMFKGKVFHLLSIIHVSIIKRWGWY